MNRGVLKRLSVVITVLWVVGVTLWLGLSQMNQSYDATSAMYRLCMEREVSVRNVDKCGDQMSKDFDETDVSAFWISGLYGGVGSALAIWLFIGLIYGVTRWVLNGRTDPPEKSL